jgi:hypothetical protein
VRSHGSVRHMPMTPTGHGLEQYRRPHCAEPDRVAQRGRCRVMDHAERVLRISFSALPFSCITFVLFLNCDCQTLPWTSQTVKTVAPGVTFPDPSAGVARSQVLVLPVFYPFILCSEYPIFVILLSPISPFCVPGNRSPLYFGRSARCGHVVTNFLKRRSQHPKMSTIVPHLFCETFVFPPLQVQCTKAHVAIIIDRFVLSISTVIDHVPLFGYTIPSQQRVTGFMYQISRTRVCACGKLFFFKGGVCFFFGLALSHPRGRASLLFHLFLHFIFAILIFSTPYVVLVLRSYSVLFCFLQCAAFPSALAYPLAATTREPPPDPCRPAFCPCVPASGAPATAKHV